MLETSGTISNQTFSILIDLGATDRFISSEMLKRIKVKEVKNEEFSYIEMDLGSKQKVGGKVTDCSLNLGHFVMNANMYVMILGYYDIVIGMD